MKVILSVLVAGGVGFAGAYYFTARQTAALRAEHAKLETQWQSEKSELEAALAKAKRQSIRVETVEKDRETPATTTLRRSAAEILENLLQIKPSGATRISAIRKIIHELEDLAALPATAVPAIRDFLSKNTDLDYSLESSGREDRGGRSGWTPPWSRRSAPTEFTLPPSLRIGLFDVLKDIGGEAAELVLSEVLGTTGRAVEVAYVARLLEAMTPGKYSALAIDAAQSLLRTPIPIDNPNRLDESAESYLYGVLEMYGDTSFSDEAGKLLVSDGQLDRNARDYLVKTKGEAAIPALLDAYQNTTFSNQWDRASLASKVLDFVGPNAQANNLLNEIVHNPDLDFRLKAGALMRLGGVDFGRGDSPQITPEMAQSRIPVFVELKAKLAADDPLMRPVDHTIVNLDNIANGKEPENPFRFGRNGGGGNGGPNNRPLPPDPTTAK